VLSHLLRLTQSQIIYEYGEYRWTNIDRGKAKNLDKSLPSANLSTTNPTWTGPGANPGLRCEGLWQRPEPWHGLPKNLNVNFRVYNRPQLDPILSEINQIQILTTILISSSHIRLDMELESKRNLHTAVWSRNSYVPKLYLPCRYSEKLFTLSLMGTSKVPG
jgi:hypothetical protein